MNLKKYLRQQAEKDKKNMLSEEDEIGRASGRERV